jgi:hypothetical protein
MSREELRQIRPVINTFNTEATSSIEQFQNEVLRPIIKFQHDWLMTWAIGLPQWKMLCSFNGKKEDSFIRINDYFSKQQDKKGIIIGAITGLMTVEELTIYQATEKEVNKRIIQMVVQRLTDSFYREDNEN